MPHVIQVIRILFKFMNFFSKISPSIDRKGQTNESDSASSTLHSVKSEPMVSEITSCDPDIKKFTNDIPSFLLKCFYVKDNERYKCGIMQCEQIIKQKDTFIAHVEAHDPNYPFICVHCKQNVGYCRERAFHHMYLHCQHLYYCMTCKYARSSRFLMVLHFLKIHLDIDVQFWYKEQIKNETHLVNVTYLCMECDIGIRATGDLSGHFYDYHESQMVDFKVSADFRNQLFNKYLVRKQLKCALCRASSGTKDEHIQHHRNMHSSKELNIKLGILELLPIKHMSKQQIEIYTANNARNDRNIIFHCGNCNENGANLFADVHKIYNHCHTKHKPMNYKFKISHLIGCHYCEYISNFREMIKHQKMVHRQRLLAIESILNPEKCGICNKKVGDIAVHCEKEHEMLKFTKVAEPVHMKEDLLLELSTFHCDFNTIQYLISGCCYEQIPVTMNGLLHHILCHLEPINCTRCSFSSSDGFKFAKHNCVQATNDILTKFRRNLHDIFFDTRIVFKNGLIVTRANLIGTGYDNDQSFAFDIFINELMNIHEGGAN